MGKAFLISMITITRNINSPITNVVYLTLAEMQDVKTTYYQLKFVHRITQQEIIVYAQDISTKTNIQKFNISSALFNNVELGFYTYYVKGANNNGTAPVGDVIETGYMVLENFNTFTPTKYNQQSKQFKTYNGG